MNTMKVLSLQSLALLDRGMIEVATRQALESIYKDCQDRPRLKRPRVVTLKIEVTPQVDNDGLRLSHVTTRINVARKIPDMQTIQYPMLATDRGPAFQPDAPDNPRQETLYETTSAENTDN